MSKITKKAEVAVADADKFPIESCREKLARRYGLDAVALSGPCEGAPLVDCVCEQLNSRWDGIRKHFAKNEKRLHKLAFRLAESLAQEDDTKECVKDLEQIGFEKNAATGISKYLKAWHIKEAAANEIDELIREVSGEEDEDQELEDLGLESPVGEENVEDFGEDDLKDDLDEVPGDLDEVPGDLGELPGEPEGPMENVGLDLGSEPGLEAPVEDMVTIELPAEVAEELVNAIEGYEHELEGTDEDFEVLDLGGAEDEAKLPGEEEVKLPGEEDEAKLPGEGLGDIEEIESVDEESEIPGETMEEGKQLVRSEEGAAMPGEGEEEVAGEMECSKCAAKETQNKEAAEMLRAGRLRRVGQSILKIGPEMAINNTDQQAGGKDLGKAKEKDVEDPKALEESNIKPEGYMANGTKVQDGSTLGREEPFDAKKISPDEVSGGQKSIMGDGESYPENKPEVPAGSAPIGGEQMEGGDVSTKGTVIATIMPDGILCKAQDHDKAVKVKIKIKEASKELVEALGKLPYDGDLKKFALEAGKLVKAKCTVTEDGVCKTDNSKLEGSKFTNDAEKKPAEGGAVAGKKGTAKKDKEETKTDTSKLESEKFTNDAEKKPAPEKAAASKNEVKTAAEKDPYADIKKHPGDKKVEEPKPLDKSNIKPEGHMAGGKDVSAGDGSVQGNEEKFTAHEVEKGEVSGGESSIMGPGESIPKGGPEVPAGGGQMGNEELDGGNVSTKGTVIAEQKKSDPDEAQKVRNEQKIREARLKAASVIVADMLAHGEITNEEYAEALEKHAKMEIPALQSLAVTIRKTREKVEASRQRADEKAQAKTAGLGIPVVHDMARDEKSFTQRLSELFSINKLLDPESYDDKGRRKN